MKSMQFFYTNLNRYLCSEKTHKVWNSVRTYQQSYCDNSLQTIFSKANQALTIQRAEKLNEATNVYSHLDCSAAVLVPLCHFDGEPCMLLNVRSPKLLKHRGLVSFPGGGVDPEDVTVIDTALRETEEEIGLQKDQVEIWTVLNPLPENRFKRAVAVVIGYVGHVDPNTFHINNDEVSELLFVPVKFLIDPANRRTTTFRFPRRKGSSGLYTTPVYLTNPKVWGYTACVIDIVLSVLVPEQYEAILLKLNRYMLKREYR